MNYQVIYADPPWMYKDKASSGRRGAEYKYPCMTQKELIALPVNDISAPNSLLFMWSTFPMIQESLELIRAWGFQYKTLAFLWVKLNRKSLTPFWGMGNWTRSNPEVCLLGVKGKPQRISKSVHSVIMSPIMKHSQKPQEARDRIVQLVGDVPRVEMFAREADKGWDTWGNQAPDPVELFS